MVTFKDISYLDITYNINSEKTDEKSNNLTVAQNADTVEPNSVQQNYRSIDIPDNLNGVIFDSFGTFNIDTDGLDFENLNTDTAKFRGPGVEWLNQGAIDGKTIVDQLANFDSSGAEFDSLRIKTDNPDGDESVITTIPEIEKYQDKLIQARKAVNDEWDEITSKNDNYRYRGKVYDARKNLEVLENQYRDDIKNYAENAELTDEQKEKLAELDKEWNESQNISTSTSSGSSGSNISTNPADWNNVFAANINAGDGRRTEVYKQRLFKGQSGKVYDYTSQADKDSGHEIDYAPAWAIMGTRRDGEDLSSNKAIMYNPGGNATLNVKTQANLAGNYIELDYGNGLLSQFLHVPDASIVRENGRIVGVKDPSNPSNVLRIGDTITAGQAFGWVGATGNSTGPHADVRHKINGTRIAARGSQLFQYLSQSIENGRPSGLANNE
ncbi:MAG: hypothetical protein HRT47_06650 [Candidatus Caenarcaniphilales bacterium]|nr:hypothetical protein [Candidatus Caenarcaniphilales bacterium]